MSAVLSLARPAPDAAAKQPAIAYVADAETAAAVAESVPGAAVCDGGLGAAIGALAQMAAPDVLIVDSSGSEDPAAGIGALAKLGGGRCRIVALGTINDVAHYRALRDAGAADYLVKPVAPKALAAAVARLGSESSPSPRPSNRPRTLFVCGARGGAGATTFAVNAAWHLSRRPGNRVALIDLDLAFGSVALALDIEPSHGLREILDNPDRIDALFVASAAARIGDTLSVFAAEEPLDGWGGFPEGTASAVERLIEGLTDSTDCIVVDMPPALAVAAPDILRHADRLALVAELNLATARDAARLSILAHDTAPDCSIALIANKHGKKSGEIDAAAFARGSRLAVDHLLPWDSGAAASAANAGQAVAEVAKSSALARALAEAVDALLPPDGQAAPDVPFWQKLLRKT